MLLGGDTQLVVERVMPDLLHVVPVGHDAVLDGVLERQDTSLALRLVADVAVLLTHADHHTLHSTAVNTSSNQRQFGSLHNAYFLLSGSVLGKTWVLVRFIPGVKL